MRKVCIFIATLIAAVGIANGAVRDEKTISRTAQKSIVSRKSEPATSARTASKKTVARTTAATTQKRTNARVQSRTAIPGRTARTATVSRTATTTPRTPNRTNNAIRNTTRTARAATTPQAGQSNLFDPDYNTCRDAYFTCMDQFCATANDTYRRCICSSKLSQVQARERALGQTADQLNDFKNLNLDVINKTADEVTAMLSATAGEQAQATARDKSNSAKQLAGISEVLSKSKSQSLSTQGTLDIAGNIDAIWSTSDLAGGANIANLTGEALYNAVHAQCSEMVIDKCNSSALQNMVTTAYGMYIENDCSALLNTLDTQKKGADTSIRQTEREMQLARLENYKAHNSTAINECIAQVRADITADTACGPDYVHCLDVTGLYLNRETGAPIYTPSFYQLETMISLSGDTLTNQSNRMLVAELNRKRAYAERGLDTCRDIADAVWDEFMRQAISEIYQGQQERVRQVKNECLEVVNKCYDEKNQSLKDFSNVKEQLLLGQRIELSEKMCQEKLDACSNLYGGGPDGMRELLIAMHNITNQTISNQCLTTLREYVHEFCAVPGNDTLHKYPFACRVYNPGDAKYASIQICNAATSDGKIDNTILNTPQIQNNGYSCEKIYISCNAGYFLMGGKCYQCPDGHNCVPGTTYEELISNSAKCGDTYIGSLYHKVARYASQACIRPSEASKPLPPTVLQDINTVMDEIRHEMATELATECQRLGGTWYDTIWQDTNTDAKHDTQNHWLHKKFYDDTAANTDWGYCGTDDETAAQTNMTDTSNDNTNNNTEQPTKYTLTLKNNNYWSMPNSTGQTILYGCKEATPAETKLTVTNGTTPPTLTSDQIPRCITSNASGKTCTFLGYTTEDCMGNTYYTKETPNKYIFELTNTNTTIEACWECK